MNIATMMRLYREQNNLTQKDFVEEVKHLCPELTVPLLSYIERMVVPAPEAIQDYIITQFINGKIGRQANENSDGEQVIVEDDFSRITGDLEIRAYIALKNLKKGERITRGELARLLQTNDRTAREVVERLRGKGIWAFSGGGAPGYFIGETIEEYRAFEREYLSHAYTALKNAAAMRNNKSDQVRLIYE